MAPPHLRVLIQNLPPEARPPSFTFEPHTDPLGELEPESLPQRPEGTHHFLFQVIHAAAANAYWEHKSWVMHPNPADHSTLSIRQRVGHKSLLAPGASAFITAHPSVATCVHSAQWSIMLRRHLDVPVYPDSISPLICTHCKSRMDNRGDHATHCKAGFGATHRQNTLRNELAQHGFHAAGLACTIEVPSLISNTDHRPADILVQLGPPPPPPRQTPGQTYCL